MLIIGAKGFAKEVLEVCHQNNELKDLAFYDDVNEEVKGLLFDKFPILKTPEQVKDYFSKYGPNFTIGIGDPHLREMMSDKFIALGGKLTSTVSYRAQIGSYDVNIGDGCNVLCNSTSSNSVTIGKGGLIYYHCIIAHDVTLGDFVQIAPRTTLLGRITVGSYTNIGANAIILPDLTVGSNVVIGAGAIVTKDVPDNTVVVGIPARIIKQR